LSVSLLIMLQVSSGYVAFSEAMSCLSGCGTCSQSNALFMPYIPPIVGIPFIPFMPDIPGILFMLTTNVKAVALVVLCLVYTAVSMATCACSNSSLPALL